jgi:hypothetical protein
MALVSETNASPLDPMEESDDVRDDSLLTEIAEEETFALIESEVDRLLDLVGVDCF